MAEFFTYDKPGLALFLNAGDPPLDVLADVVTMLDEEGVDCLELAVPFPGSVTDGPVIRRSAQRALDRGVDLDQALAFVAATRPKLRRLRIALLADWSHTFKGRPLAATIADIAASTVDGMLAHALPPRLRDDYRHAARDAGLPIVTTCYHKVSSPEVLADAAANAEAYLYLVAQYGRSGNAPAEGYAGLAETVSRLRADSAAPIAVGFGVRTRADVLAVRDCGADAVVVGSAVVAQVEDALAKGTDVVARLRDFVRSITPSLATAHITAGSRP
jgi:tryptophan synthase alpha chain